MLKTERVTFDPWKKGQKDPKTAWESRGMKEGELGLSMGAPGGLRLKNLAAYLSLFSYTCEKLASLQCQISGLILKKYIKNTLL